MFTTCCRRHAASSGQRGASCTRYDARRARRRRRDQARREFTVLAGNWASSDTAARAATASRRVVHCTAQLALLRRAKRVPPPPPPLLKRSGVSVKTGPRLRDDMSIHTKPLFLSKRLPGTGERVGTGSVSGSHPAQEVHRRKSLPWTNTRAQEESTDRMLPRKGETRRWRRTSVVARASRVNNMAACTGIQSPAAAMGAGPLGSVTLPVWAQPWYALC